VEPTEVVRRRRALGTRPQALADPLGLAEVRLGGVVLVGVEFDHPERGEQSRLPARVGGLGRADRREAGPQVLAGRLRVTAVVGDVREPAAGSHLEPDDGRVVERPRQ